MSLELMQLNLRLSALKKGERGGFIKGNKEEVVQMHFTMKVLRDISHECIHSTLSPTNAPNHYLVLLLVIIIYSAASDAFAMTQHVCNFPLPCILVNVLLLLHFQFNVSPFFVRKKVLQIVTPCLFVTIIIMLC